MRIEFEHDAIWIGAREAVRVKANDQDGQPIVCLIPRETFDDHFNGDGSNDYVTIFEANRERLLLAATKLIEAGITSADGTIVLETKYF